MSSLRAQYQVMSVQQLEDLLRNAVLDAQALTICKSVINEKLGEQRYKIDDQGSSSGSSSDSEVVAQPSHYKKGSMGKQIMWIIWAVLGVGYLFTSAIPMATRTNNPGIVIGAALFVAFSIYKAIKANPQSHAEKENDQGQK